MEATSWYRDKNEEKEEKEKDNLTDKDNDLKVSFDFKEWGFKCPKIINPETKSAKGNWRKGATAKKKREKERLAELLDGEKVIEKDRKIQGVIFLQHTEHSKLAHNIREKLKVLESVGTFKIKIVERTGSTLVDTLHKSNAWADQDCLREDCRICTSTIKGVKKGSCRRRNVTYETFCITCQKQEQEKLHKEVQENSDRMSAVVDDDPIEYLCELFNDNLENSLVARFEKSTSNRYKLNSSSADENRLE